MSKFAVVCNFPGCLPEAEPEVFDTEAEALEFAVAMVDRDEATGIDDGYVWDVLAMDCGVNT
jgi:hypothetical protein